MSIILETLRRALETTDESRYSIARGSGVDASQLCRLVSGERGLSIEAAETLADYLDLEIIIRPKRGRRKA
jgi:plasmid maintenance system antidote protein VapI